MHQEKAWPDKTSAVAGTCGELCPQVGCRICRWLHIRARPRSRWVTCLCLEQAAKRQVFKVGSLEWACMHLKVCSEGPTSAFCLLAPPPLSPCKLRSKHPSSCHRLMPPLGFQGSLLPVSHSSVTSHPGSFTAVLLNMLWHPTTSIL